MPHPRSGLAAMLPNIVDDSAKKRNMREKSAQGREPVRPVFAAAGRSGGVLAPDSRPRQGGADHRPGGLTLTGGGISRRRAARVITLGSLRSLHPAGAAQVEFRQGKVLRPGDFDVVGAGRHDPGLAALALHGLGFVSRHLAFRHHGGKTFP